MSSGKATIIAALITGAATVGVGVLGYLKSGEASFSIVDNVKNGTRYLFTGKTIIPGKSIAEDNRLQIEQSPKGAN